MNQTTKVALPNGAMSEGGGAVRASNRWLSMGVVTALADTELPTITERTEMQIKTISAVVGRSQSTINSAPLHISNICSANYAGDEGIQFHTFGWVPGYMTLPPSIGFNPSQKLFFSKITPEEKSMAAGAGENFTFCLILISVAGSFPKTL